jgi:hypothetical protein
VFATATAAEICAPGYSESVRAVSTRTKRGVYAEYGIKKHAHARGRYEVDHLISLELGGSNSLANLWPEAAVPRPGFHEKDVLENLLHDRVCAGTVTLAAAQQAIAGDWVAEYSAAQG